MKKEIILFMLVSLLLGCSGTREETWCEDFNGNHIDTLLWTRISKGGADWSKNMASYPELAEVSNGKLILRGVKNTMYPNDSLQFITGGIESKNKKFFSKGKIEVKARFSSCKGFWPAIWLMPEGNSGWPSGGEIDIMEHLNHDNIVYQTVHSLYTYKHGIKDNPKSSVISIHEFEQWNVYGVEMFKDSICFFVNDKLTMCYPHIKTEIEGQFPFSEAPFYLILSAQLGGGWVGEITPEQLPAQMEIDWIKFYDNE